LAFKLKKKKHAIIVSIFWTPVLAFFNYWNLEVL
jgi:hypothetical protein